MNPGSKRVEMVYGDESPDGINAVPTVVEDDDEVEQMRKGSYYYGS
jgi:hypothetical protein